MATPKELGNAAFKAQDFSTAVGHYTEAIDANPTDHTIYGNRSASYHNLKKYNEALADGAKCVELNTAWAKGHQRQAMALHGLGKFEESLEAYENGLKIDPNNAQMKAGMDKVHQDLAAQMRSASGGMGGMGGAGLGGMFGPEGEAKLKANPRIAKYFEDPTFQTKWSMCQQNPQMMMQLLQTDPRLMDVFKELTGVDLLQMNEDKQKNQAQEDELKKKAKVAAEAKKVEDERKRKEAEEAALPEEERNAIDLKKKAEAVKAEGTVFYKARNFEKALEFYGKAIELCPNELTYHSNKAAVYFEMKNYDACLQACDDAVEAAKTGGYDYVKLAKVLARKGNALLQQKKYDESIAIYNKALIENNDHSIKMQLQKAQKTKKDEEAKAYINPEIAEEHRTKGNEFFKDGKYPAAIKEYEEGLKRNPTSIAIFSNRCAAYIKLMEPTTALKDADKCLELDPKFVKAYGRKGTCHHLMKEYHKAMKAFEDGLKIDPTSKDCQDGKNRTLMTIQQTAGASGGNDEERLQHAMADPEIQRIMSDPLIQQTLKDLSENPKSAMGALKDPYIGDCINKLVAAGVVKMG